MNQPFFFDTTRRTSKQRLDVMRAKLVAEGLKEEPEVIEVFGPSADTQPDKVMDMALISAAANGKTELTELLVHYVGEQGRASALGMAVNRNRPHTLAKLLPWNHPNLAGTGMETAIRNKSMPLFDVLLPCVDPKSDQSQHLEVALICGNIAAAKKLMPVSEPWLFARKMRRDNLPNFEAMTQLWTQSLMEHGAPLPPPTRSVKLLLKLTPNVQAALRHLQLAQALEADTTPARKKPRL